MILFKLELAKQSDAGLSQYVQDKIHKISAGAIEFPSAQPMMQPLLSKLAEYNSCLEVVDGNKSDTIKKKGFRKGLEVLITQVAVLCALDAAEDENRFIRSGFAIKSKGSPSLPIPKPMSYKFILGEEPGQAISTIETFPKPRKGYAHAWTSDPLAENSFWTVIPFPYKQYTYQGLPSGVRIWSKGGAVSANGQINYSDPVSRIIQ